MKTITERLNATTHPPSKATVHALLASSTLVTLLLIVLREGERVGGRQKGEFFVFIFETSFELSFFSSSLFFSLQKKGEKTLSHPTSPLKTSLS